jgi:hypothetical protein
MLVFKYNEFKLFVYSSKQFSIQNETNQLAINKLIYDINK